MRERERDGAAVTIEARRVAVPRPPVLAVPDDAARPVCVEREVVTREYEPRGLRLDEDHTEGRSGIHPVLEVEDELHHGCVSGKELNRCCNGRTFNEPWRSTREFARSQCIFLGS